MTSTLSNAEQTTMAISDIYSEENLSPQGMLDKAENVMVDFRNALKNDHGSDLTDKANAAIWAKAWRTLRGNTYDAVEKAYINLANVARTA